MSTNTEIPTTKTKIAKDVTLYDAAGNIIVLNADGSLNVQPAVVKSTITQVFTNELVNDTASHNSTEFDCSAYKTVSVYLQASDSGTATDFRVKAQFENPDGNWHGEDYGFWADLRWSSLYVTGTVRKRYIIENVGDNIRLNIAAVGANVSNYFTINAWLQGHN